MIWRRSSAMNDFLMELADQFKRLPQALFTLEAVNTAGDTAALPGPALNG